MRKRGLTGRDTKPGAALRSARRKPRDLFGAIEAANDGTRRDVWLSEIAAKLREFGVIGGDDLFISSYDIVEDRESFFFVGRRGGG